MNFSDSPKSLHKEKTQPPPTLDETAELLRGGPSDRYNLIWISCLLLGLGQVFPINALITSADYFDLLFAPFPIAFYIPICYNWGNFLTFLWLTKYGIRFDEKSRLYLSFFFTFVIFFLYPIFNNKDGWDVVVDVRIVLNLIGAFGLGITCSIMYGTSFSLVALLPRKYTVAIMAGNGLAGVFAGVVKICFNFWWLPGLSSDPYQMEISAILYFSIASSLMLVSTYSTWYLSSSLFYLYRLEQSKAPESPPSGVSSISEPDRSLKVETINVFKKIWVDELHVCVVFTVTLSSFPGPTTLIRNYDEELSNHNFCLILISIFQLFDFVGRLIPKWFRYPTTSKYLPIPIWARMIFYPLFALSVYTDLFPNNFIPYIVMMLFAFSNGYLSTLCMMYGIENVKKSEAKTAASLMAFFCNFGIFIGSHLALLFKFHYVSL